MGRISNLWVLTGLVLLAVSFCDLHVSADVIPSENECRPYIEKAIHELKNVDTTVTDDKDSNESTAGDDGSVEGDATPEAGAEDDGVDSKEDGNSAEEAGSEDKSDENTTQENQTEENASVDGEQDDGNSNESTPEVAADGDDDSKEDGSDDTKSVEDGEQKEADADSKEDSGEKNDADSKEDDTAENQADDDNSQENAPEDGNDSKEDNSATADDDNDSKETAEAQESGEASQAAESTEGSNEQSGEQAEAGSLENATAENTDEDGDSKQDDGDSKQDNAESNEDVDSKQEDGDSKQDDGDSKEAGDETKEDDSKEAAADSKENDGDSKENDGDSKENDGDSKENADDSKENTDDSKENNTAENDDGASEEKVRAKRSLPDEAQSDDGDSAQADDGNSQENGSEDADGDSKENAADSQEGDNDTAEEQPADDDSKEADAGSDETTEDEETDEDDLTIEFEIPKNLRPHGHVNDLLGLDAESSIKEDALRKTGDVILKDLKKVFDNAIKPLESMYKYRDLSNRHFGDPEIFSKPLVLFMGPWSGGKSTILNYLTGNEYTPNSIRSGAEPSPAYFNIMMHGDEPEVLDGTQLAADWTFSGLQKFGQGLMDRLRGQKLPSKLLERVNIVEIPGILEVRKQVSRYFPFNDACQWFIDRADIIFLVYDPSKLDVGPETEAILDQLKGREYQTRILLNKADQVKPEELLRVQGALIWNISPLMASAQPPVMYTVSLWSHPFESGAPIRLLQAQERAFLADLREAIDKRIENKIASARRFAVRIRNHAKMVDCYLTTYYNQKGLFSNKKQVSDKIIENPQNFNIYEGLSTLTNISRYDLPDPEVYLDFFKLNPLYEFKKLSETCTYFKGCPINKLDIAIAYELPELVGKYKKIQEQNMVQLRKEYDDNCNVSESELPVKISNSR